MRILVFSDTHGNTNTMYNIISQNRTKCELVIHLGDCFTDIDCIRNDFPYIAFLGVKGNCDLFSSSLYPISHTFTLEGLKFFITHGHSQRVDTGFELLRQQARNENANIAIFGHTHVALVKEFEDITVFNPGSLTRARDSKGNSYGIIDISNKKAKFSIIRTESEKNDI